MPSETLDLDPDAKRLACLRTWTNSLRRLGEVASGEVRQKIEASIEFLDTNTRIGIPIVDPQGERFGVWREGDAGNLAIIALIKTDRDLHPFFRHCIDSSHFSFCRDLTSVMLPNRRLTSNWRGIVLHHELRHGKNQVDGQFTQPHERFIEEQSIYKVDHEIIRDLYGGDYVTFINAAAKVVSINMLRHGKVSRSQLDCYTERAMNEVMDQPQSRTERTLRKGAVALDLAFTALRHINKETPETRSFLTQNLFQVFAADPNQSDLAA